MNNQCQFCSSIFKNKYILKTHILESKRCLKLRENKCLSCLHNCIDQDDLEIHLLTCKDHIIKELKQEHKEETERLKQEHKQETERLKQEHKLVIDKLEQKIDSLIKDTINRPMIHNNTTINNIRNHLSMTYTLESLKDDEISNLLKENMTTQVFMNGQSGIAKMCTDKIINTKDNKKRLLCTDMSRNKFKYIDQQGNLKEDIEARNFINKVSKPIKDIGKDIYDGLMDCINQEKESLDEEDDKRKDKLLNDSMDIAERYRDILGIDHPKHNKEFMNELSRLNKE